MRQFISSTQLFIATILMASMNMTFAHEGYISDKLLSNPPTEHSGLKVTGKDALSLGEQIPAMDGYQVRVRTVTMKPGGIAKNHAHDTRPGAFYVVKGEVTDVRGKEKTIIKAGEAVLENKNTEHWVINNTKKEAVLFVFDIVAVE